MTQSLRLPHHVHPSAYRIALAPDLRSFTFTGSVEIDATVVEPTTEIVLNAADLEIRSARVDAAEVSFRLDEDAEQLTLTLDEEHGRGDCLIEIEFDGEINDQLHGFYRSVYVDEAGTEHVIATTQFESTDARRAFPCFDEPEFKATFTPTLIVDDTLAAISNGSIVEEEPLGDGRRRVSFAPTMRMSTYLVAFVVGPLEATRAVDVDGTPLRVAHVPGKEALTPFALESGAHSLRFFTEYFGIPYPGDKLDLIALPDFAFGAMENVGAVTFRETALLVDTDSGSRLDLERVADVVAHEVAHMWFGDLVTMKWWNGIWLNEAFATFMELLAVDDFRPEWERWVSFSTSRAHAMAIDSTTRTRPIEYPVVTPEDADGMFDVLTYQKGASVVRMLEQYVGAEEFREGIRSYMERHKYANTETTDLWDAIEDSTGQPVRSLMDTWIFQGGHPLVSVERHERGFRLTQRRFLYLDQSDDTRWDVPVLYRTAGGSGKALLTGEDLVVDLGGPVDWVVVNAGGSGFFRCSYERTLLDGLLADSGPKLDAVERFNLVGDTWSVVLAGLAPLGDFVALVERLARVEDDAAVWSAILEPFDRLVSAAGDDVRPRVEELLRRLAGAALERVGWQAADSEPERTGTLRALLVRKLGTIGADEDVRRRATELFERFTQDRTAVDPDLVPAILGVVAVTGGEGEFTAFLERFRHGATPQEQIRSLYALGDFRHPALVRRTLDMLLSGEVRTQNAPFLLNELLGNPVAGEDAWHWLEEHWDEVTEKWPDNSHNRMVANVVEFDRPDLAARVTAFLEAHPVRAGNRTVEQLLEHLQVNVAFATRAAPELARLFA